MAARLGVVTRPPPPVLADPAHVAEIETLEQLLTTNPASEFSGKQACRIATGLAQQSAGEKFTCIKTAQLGPRAD